MTRLSGSTRIVAARAGSKPIFTSSTLIRLRISRPAPTSSTQAKATSDTTRALRTQVRPRPSVDPRLASFSALVITDPDACSAGATPKTRPVTSARITAKPSAAPSVRTSRSSGMLTASSWVSSRVPPRAMIRPSTAPLHDSTSPSVSSCASSRRRPAPSAMRMATSFCRAAVRASSRFDRLAQTISMTMPTAPASTHAASRTLPLTCSDSGRTMPSKVLRSGCSRTICGASARISACAPAGVAPPFSRPIIAMVLPQRLVSGLSGNGK